MTLVEILLAPLLPPLTAMAVVELGDDPGVRTNVEVAVETVSGTYLAPNRFWSFNLEVGPRTVRAGYVPGDVLFEARESTGVGGGICRLATAIYWAAMRAGVEVMDRAPHSRPRPYVAPGIDAAVNWPDLDLTLWNDTGGPLLIEAVVDDSEPARVVVAIYSWNEATDMQSEWVPGKHVPFAERTLRTPYHPEGHVIRRGAPGEPGKRVWWRGVPFRFEAVRSEYKPVDELVAGAVEESKAVEEGQ